MTTAEELRVLLFFSLVVVVYVCAAAILIKVLFQKLQRNAPSPSQFQLWFRRVALTLAGVGLLCFAYGYFVEPYWLAVSHIKITSPKIPPGSQPLRIVHISDLHSDAQTRLEGRLPQAIAAERPDIIVFTGDSINSPAGLPVFKGCLSAIAKIAPTYVVKGNWDAWYWAHLDLFNGTGAHELNGNSVALRIRGLTVGLAGIGVENETAMKEALHSIPAQSLKVFLFHYPDLIHEAAAEQVDLYCAGHTHGGQVALPLYGALITFSKYGKRYEAGLYREGNTWLYVNRGIGMEGGLAPRVRFWARPEITVIDLGPP